MQHTNPATLPTQPGAAGPWAQLPDANRDALVRMAGEANWTLHYAATMLGCRAGEVLRWAACRGLPPLRREDDWRDGAWAHMTPEERDEAALRPGNQDALAADLGIKADTLGKWRRQRGLKRPGQRATRDPAQKGPTRPRNFYNNRIYNPEYNPDPNAPNLWGRLTNDGRKAYIAEADAAGTSRSAQAAALGIKNQWISKWAAAAGLPPPPRAYHNPRVRAAGGLAGRPLHPESPWFGKTEDEQITILRAGLVRVRTQMELAAYLKVGREKLRAFARAHNIKMDFPLNHVRTGPRNAPAQRTAEVETEAEERTRPPAVTRRPPADTATRVHIYDTKSSQCKFPLWGDGPLPSVSELFYCGAPVEHELTSYCASCRKLTVRRSLGKDDLSKLQAARQRARVAGRHTIRPFIQSRFDRE